MVLYERLDTLGVEFPGGTFAQRVKGAETLLNDLPSKLAEYLVSALGPKEEPVPSTVGIIFLVSEIQQARAHSLDFNNLVNWVRVIEAATNALQALAKDLVADATQARLDGKFDLATQCLDKAQAAGDVLSSIQCLPRALHDQLEQEKDNLRAHLQDVKSGRDDPFAADFPELLCATMSSDFQRHKQLRDLVAKRCKELGHAIADLSTATTVETTKHVVGLLGSLASMTILLPKLRNFVPQACRLHKDNANALADKVLVFAQNCSQAHYSVAVPCLQLFASPWTDQYCAMLADIVPESPKVPQTSKVLEAALHTVAAQQTDLAQAISVLEGIALDSRASEQDLCAALAQLQQFMADERERRLTAQPAHLAVCQVFKGRLLQASKLAAEQLSAGDPTLLAKAAEHMRLLAAMKQHHELPAAAQELVHQAIAVVQAAIADLVTKLRRALDENLQQGRKDACTTTYRQASALTEALGEFCAPPPLEEFNKCLRDLFASKIATVADVTQPGPMAKLLVSLKQLVGGINVHEVQALLAVEIDQLLERAFARAHRDQFYQLGVQLQTKHGAMGVELLHDHPKYFDAVLVELRNKATTSMTDEHAMSELLKLNADLKAEEADKLLGLLRKFRARYEQLLDQYLYAFAPPPLEELVSLTKRKATAPGQRSFSRSYLAVSEDLPGILAGIFAVWSTQTSRDSYSKTNKVEAVRKPHPVQLLAIFRMLSMDSGENSKFAQVWDWFKRSVATSLPQDKFNGHLVELGTGEGKSLVLAVLAICLSLLGFEPYVACYSTILSTRDEGEFAPLFDTFGVRGHITYGTISHVTNAMLNKEGDVRALTLAVLNGSGTSGRRLAAADAVRPSILLLDEVDVFFSNDFCGDTYNAVCAYTNATVVALFKHLWAHYKTAGAALPFTNVQQLPLYAELMRPVSVDARAVIADCVQRMCRDLAAFRASHAHPRYMVQNDQLAYVTTEGHSVSTFYGYTTAFQFLQAVDEAKVTRAHESTYLALHPGCGSFSFAELPKAFAGGILGVTGTLSCLERCELEFIQSQFRLTQRTRVPSIYGGSKRDFKPLSHVKLYDTADRHHQMIVDAANEATAAGRPVLVFFEDDAAIERFQQSSYGQGLAAEVINSRTPRLDVPVCVRRAVDPRKVTLWTREFGRGQDFLCHDSNVNTAGGVLVIQAFYSSEQSEEVQIQGRTARQGNMGGYRLMLLNTQVATALACGVQAVQSANQSAEVHAKLAQMRQAKRQAAVAASRTSIATAGNVHAASMEYRQALLPGSGKARADVLKQLLRLQQL